MSTDQQLGRFVGIANGRYRHLAELPNAVDDTEKLGEVFATLGLAPTILPNHTESQLRNAVRRELDAARVDDILIVLWTGHGVQGADRRLRLYARGRSGDVEVFDGAALGELAALSKAREVLVIVDACFSGAALVDAAQAADAILGTLAEPADGWFCVIAACLSDEPALAGAMAREIRRLLTEVPTDPADRERFSSRNSTVRGDDFVAALKRNWGEPRQHPQLVRLGASERPLMRNPFYRRTRLSAVVEHLRLAARGTEGDGNFFTGRHDALRSIVSAMAEARTGVIVVTGSAGCGKSALVGRLVSLGDSEERATIVADGEPLPAGTDPGIGSIVANLHVRGMKPRQAFTAIGDQLGLAPDASRYDVLAELARRQTSAQVPTIVIDGLDEVGSDEDVQRFVVDVIAALSVEAIVIVASRSITSSQQSTDVATLFGRHRLLVDLDQDATTARDVEEYVVRRLRGVCADMDQRLVADVIVARHREHVERDDRDDGGLFLLARLVTSQLRSAPVDTSQDGWTARLATSVGDAMEADLVSTVLTVDGTPHPTAARELLGALALAHGSGFPVDIWVTVADSASASSTTYARDDVFAVLAELGRHVVTEEADGIAVYRIAHRALRDHLRSGPGRSTSGETTASVLDALAGDYRRRLDRGTPAPECGYLWHQFWRHAVDAGDHGIDVLRELVDQDRQTFLLDLGLALSARTDALFGGDVPVATAQLEEAAAIFRELERDDDLRWVLVGLAGVYALALDYDRVQDTARELAMRLHQQDDHLSRVAVAMALTAAAVALRATGQPSAALQLADEALTLLGDDPDGTGAGPPTDSGEAVVIAAALNQRAMALIVSDPQRALRTAQRSLQLTEAAIDDTDRVLLPDALSVVYFAAIQAAEPEVAERTFARLLRCADDPSYEGTLGALAVAISLTAHAQTKLARGLEDTTPEQILGIIGRAAELLEPLVATLSFAAVAHADAWLTAIGAGLVDDDDIAALAATLDAELRTLVDVFPAAGDALARLFLARIAHEPDGEVRAELAQEAVALADNPTSPAATITFVNANVAAMTVFPLGAAMNDAARRRLIVSADRWRSLGSRGEVMLLSLRSSEVWVLVGQGRVHEARAMVELAAHDAAVLDPRDPEVAMGLAVLALNEGVVLMLGRDNEAARRSLLRSVRHNHHPTDDARRDFAVLAALNLACVAVERGRPRVAFRHIARARRLGADVRPEIHVRLLLFEARAVAATGDLAGAHELTVDAINRLIDIVRDDPSLLPVLGEALNDGGAFAWTDAELRLGDQPIWRDIRRHYAPRTSTPSEIAMRLATFLASAVGAEEQVGLRTAVRQRRVADPEAFDRGWVQATGDHPAWLDFDLEQYNLVIGWFNTNSWLESREFLRANPQLLEPVSREMLDELGLDDEPDDDEESMEAIHRALLVDAQAIGIDDAFAALIGYNAIQEWDADGYSPEAYDRLRDDLRHPRALDRFTTPEARVLAASLRAAFELIDRGEVTLAVDALREDFRQDWARVLDVARSATDVQRFAALVTLAATAADDVFEAASITSARVVAAVLTGAVEEAGAIVAELGSAAERSAVEDALLDAMRTHRDRTTQLATMLDHLRSAT